MGICTVPREVWEDCPGRKLARTLAAALAAVGLVCGGSAPASANTSESATLAPIGSGSYLLTVTNLGSETIPGFTAIPTGMSVTNVVPNSACQIQGSRIIRWIACGTPIAPAASMEVCYSGQSEGRSVASAEVSISGPQAGYVYASPAPPVSSCPIASFSPTSESDVPAAAGMPPSTASTPSSGGRKQSGKHQTTGTKDVHAWSHAQCKSTYMAWTRRHRHASRARKRTETSELHKEHGCPLTIPA